MDQLDVAKREETAASGPVRWWSDFISEDMEFEIEMSGKLVLLEKILRHCERVGDKM